MLFRSAPIASAAAASVLESLSSMAREVIAVLESRGLIEQIAAGGIENFNVAPIERECGGNLSALSSLERGSIGWIEGWGEALEDTTTAVNIEAHVCLEYPALDVLV